MAVAPLTPNEQEELNRLLEENAEIKERIRILNEKIALATGSERDDLEAMAQTEKIRLRLQTDSAKELKKRQKFLEDEESEQYVHDLIQMKSDIMIEKISHLKNPYKQVIEMRELKKMAYKDIADDLGRNLSTIKSYIFKLFLESNSLLNNSSVI